MADPYELLIKNGTVASPGGLIAADIAVRGGRIAAIGALGDASAAEVFDATGLHVLPGVIDTQVHFREPGSEHKEDLESGTRGAALGGVTAVFEMPNTNPTTTTTDALADKFQRCEGRAWVDHAFFVGAAVDNIDQLAALESLPGVPGVKIFVGSSTGSLLVDREADIAAVLANGHKRFAVHSEDEARLRARKPIAEEAGRPHMHPEWRDVEAAVISTQRILRLARAAGRPAHVLHITTAEEMEILADHKDIATVEVTPQHLTFSAPDCYDRLGTYVQMNPPIRGAAHTAALWRAVNEGLVDCIGSDHSPHTAEEKAQAYPASPSGMPGVQTLLPVMLTHAAQGRLTLERVIDLTSAGPQRVWGIARKGRIARGYDADFAIVDLKAEREVTLDWLATKAGWSAFEGMRCTGWPVATVLRGAVVMRDGQMANQATGRPVEFIERAAN
ncbi:MAG: dihydroorotase [Alphaproteobacteria bacterium]|nr:dihydroorotase [Alphaproteobacteria bacterium]